MKNKQTFKMGMRLFVPSLKLEVVRYLAEQGPEASRVQANVQDGDALINASICGDLEVIQYLVEEGSEASRVLSNTQDTHGHL